MQSKEKGAFPLLVFSLQGLSLEPRGSRATGADHWLISAGKDGELWPTFWSERLVALGWPALGDVRQYNDRKALTKAIPEQWPECKPGQIRMSANRLWLFCHDVGKGEPIFVRCQAALTGAGKAEGDYEFLRESHPLRNKLRPVYFREEFPNIRRVHWLSLWGGLKQPLTFTRLIIMR